METNEEVFQEDQETPEESSDSETEKGLLLEDEVSPEEIADLRKKADASSKNFERAKKAEEELKALKEAAKEGVAKEGQEDVGQLTPKDYLSLTENKVSSEDFDEVVRISKILNKPISEALKDKTLKSILQERQEERVTAQATQVKTGARGAKKTSGEALLEKAENTGEIPDTPEGIKAMAQARIDRAKQK